MLVAGETKKQTAVKAGAFGQIKVRLYAYEAGVLNKTLERIVACVENSGATVETLLRLPLHKALITVNRGPHIDKKAREQFFYKKHKAVIWISPNEQTRDALKSLSLPYGVFVRLQA